MLQGCQTSHCIRGQQRPPQNHPTRSRPGGQPRPSGDGGKGALPFNLFYHSSLSNPSPIAVTLTDGRAGLLKSNHGSSVTPRAQLMLQMLRFFSSLVVKKKKKRKGKDIDTRERHNMTSRCVGQCVRWAGWLQGQSHAQCRHHTGWEPVS